MNNLWFFSVTGMGGIALDRNENTPSFFWPGFEFKNYNWHPVLTGGWKHFSIKIFSASSVWFEKTLPLPPQKLFYFNWQKGGSWAHGCHFSFRPPFSVKFSLKTFHFLVFGSFCVIFLLAEDTQMIERNEEVGIRHLPLLPRLAISNGWRYSSSQEFFRPSFNKKLSCLGVRLRHQN